MSFEIFDKETAVIDGAKKALKRGVFEDPAHAKRFEGLLKEYEKLFKTSKRLVRLSDRNEAELNKLAKSLDEKKWDGRLPPLMFSGLGD